jgi:hypothetical protein
MTSGTIVVLGSFFELGEGLLVLSCNFINCDLDHAKITSSVSKMVFKNISFFLEDDRRADAADVGDQTFRQTFENMGG